MFIKIYEPAKDTSTDLVSGNWHIFENVTALKFSANRTEINNPEELMEWKYANFPMAYGEVCVNCVIWDFGCEALISKSEGTNVTAISFKGTQDPIWHFITIGDTTAYVCDDNGKTMQVIN
ncbi:MAG: hypothetical protein MI745_14120 [Pseudomonadales bacterium]|nr:hypothetical protein [Pseudomonadales bacterium]